jgi:hypothetical protein
MIGRAAQIGNRPARDDGDAQPPTTHGEHFAHALGLALPQRLPLRVDEVIE